MSTFRAAVLTAPGVVEVRRLSRPALGPHDVRLRVRRTGVCGTDLALWSGSYPVPLPLVPGHELVADVVERGAEVSSVAKGDRVVPEINATCLARHDPDPCTACRTGLASHCIRRSVVGIIEHGGGFAEELVVPEGCLHVLSDDLSDAKAAFVEPVAAALQTFVMAGDPRGQRVLVLGPGRLGALIVAVAAHLGAHVAAAARSERSHDRARRFGAHAVFDAEDVEGMRSWSGGLGADVVVEVTGVAGQIGRALDLVRPRGTVAVKSTPGTPATVDLTRVVVDEIRIVGSRCGPFDRAIAWLSETALPVEELVESSFDLDHTADAFEAAKRLSKVVVEP